MLMLSPMSCLKNKRQVGGVQFWIHLETILLSLVLFLAINTVSERIRVESISMQPTLFPGDYVIVNKLAYQIYNHSP